MEIGCIVLLVVFGSSLLMGDSQNNEGVKVNWCDEKLDCELPNCTDVIVLKNTACQSPEYESIHHCHHMVKRPTSSIQKSLLAFHNSFRDGIASGRLLQGWPEASNMRQMSWDDSLAEQALSWAFHCDDSAQDPCRTHPVYEDEGQNVVALVISDQASNPDLADVFRKWIREAAQAPSSIVTSMAHGNYLHFAQIIFHQAHKVGCGVIDYHDPSGKKALRVVCNYDSEYIMGEPLYEQGENCKNCPSDSTCKPESTYKHLCAVASDSVTDDFLLVDFDEQTMVVIPEETTNDTYIPNASTQRSVESPSVGVTTEPAAAPKGEPNSAINASEDVGYSQFLFILLLSFRYT